MPVHVAFTPGEAAPAAVGVVVDVLRATSTIAQALASGYDRVLCCAEIEEARALRAELPDSLLGGERTHAATAAELVAQAFPSALDALNARTYGPPGLGEDIAYCAQEDLLDVVPELAAVAGAAAEILSR